jgi:hypothetical protein
MDTGDIGARFERDGFLRVPDVLSRDQVSELRQFCARIFLPGNERRGDDASVKTDAFCRFPEIRWLLVQPKLVSTLETLLGKDFVYMHEWACHQNGFGGWHKDTTSQELAGHRFHYEKDYRHIQVAFYLQDNGPYGGGLDVLRGSHLDAQDPHVSRGVMAKVRGRLRTYGLLPEERRFQSVPSKAGDLVLFHFRMSHRATQPKILPVPEEHRKFAIFLTASRANAHAASFVRWIEAERSPHLADHQRPAELAALLEQHGHRLV